MLKFGMKYLKKSKYTLIFYIILSFFVGVISLMVPLISGNIINIITTTGDYKALITLSTIFFVLSVIRLILQIIAQKLYIITQANTAFVLNATIVEHVQHLPLEYVHTQNTVYLNQRINSDSNSIIIFLISLLNNIPINIITLIFSVIYIFYINKIIGVSLTLLVFMYLMIYFVLKKRIYKMSMLYKENQAHFISSLNDQLVNIRFVKIHSLYKIFSRKLFLAFTKFFNSVKKTQLFFFIYGSFDSIVGIISQLIIFLVGGFLVIQGKILIGTFTIIISYYQYLMQSVKYFSNLGKDYQDCIVSYNRIMEILNEKKDQNGKKQIKDLFSITLSNLSFSYKHEAIINNLSYTFKRGKIYGIVGKNGSGKSTLVDLIIGLHPGKYRGTIAYNSTSIDQINMIKTRFKNISFIEQNPMLLNETVSKNLLLTKNHSKNLCINVINSLGFAPFFKRLPEGLNTIINEKSNNISGGEKQKITIVRQLSKSADLIICDEPTSALDIQSRNQLLNYLTEIKKNKIIIIIAHDDKIVDYYDEVLSLE